MKRNKSLAGLLPLSLAVTLGACAPGVVPSVQPGQQRAVLPVQSSQVSTQPEQVKTHHVTFHISFPRDFQLTDINVTAKYARLRVQGLVNGQLVTKFPTNSDADANGFVPINGSNVNVGADIPEGNNWVLLADMHVNNNPASNPLNRVMGAFHVTAAGSPTVDVNPRSYLAGMIVSALQEMKSSLLSTALDLASLKDFCDALTGASGTGDATTFSRLNTTGLSKPNQLSGRALALALANGTAMTTAGGQGLTPGNYRQMPYVANTYNLVPGGAPILNKANSGIPVLSPDTGNIFFMDYFRNTQDDSYLRNNLYAWNASLTEQLKTTKTDNFFGFASSGHGPGNLPVLYANTNGSTQNLRALNQTDGSQAWSFTFGGSSSSNTFFPASILDTKGTGATNDDEDVVYSYFPGASASQKGIYAVQGGTARWFYPTASLTMAPAISADGNALYILTNSTTAAQLISLPTRSGGNFIDKVNGGCACNLFNIPNVPNWTVSLGRGTITLTAPAVGTDGTVYVGTYSGTTSGYLEAYTPAGTKKWEIALPPSVTPAAGLYPKPTYSPLIDSQNGHDVIYVFTDDARVFAINDDGTAKWKDSNNQIQAVQLGSTPDAPTSNPSKVFTSGAPVLGVEPLSNARILYTGINNITSRTEVTAVRDDGSSGKLLWSKFLGGTFNNGGFVLKDGYLYYSTVDGGEGTVSAFQRAKVEAGNVPASAPWPVFGGNPALSGRRQIDVNP